MISDYNNCTNIFMFICFARSCHGTVLFRQHERKPIPCLECERASCHAQLEGPAANAAQRGVCDHY